MLQCLCNIYTAASICKGRGEMVVQGREVIGRATTQYFRPTTLFSNTTIIVDGFLKQEYNNDERYLEWIM